MDISYKRTTCQSLCLTSSHRVFARFIHAVPRIRSFSLSDNVSLYSYTSFIHASVDASLADIHTQVFVWAYVSTSLEYMPKSGISWSNMITLCLIFEELPILSLYHQYVMVLISAETAVTVSNIRYSLSFCYRHLRDMR